MAGGCGSWHRRTRADDGTVRATVAPVELPADDLLAGLRGQANALILRTDLLGEIAICQLDGSLTQTAYALRERSRHDPETSRARSAASSNPLMGVPFTTRERHGTGAEREQLVVRGVIFFDVLRGERIPFA